MQIYKRFWYAERVGQSLLWLCLGEKTTEFIRMTDFCHLG